jgi:hypothetical protein
MANLPENIDSSAIIPGDLRLLNNLVPQGTELVLKFRKCILEAMFGN